MLSLMADTETLALEDNAVILQIGLIAFDGDFNVVGQLDVKLDIASSLMDGFVSNPDTASKFWGNQSASVVRSVMYDQPRLPPKDAARVVDQWLKDTFKGEFTIWANGILFDIPKLDKFMTRYGLKTISSRTKYNRVYDFRTLRTTAQQLYPENVKHAESIMINQLQHNALADCMWQVGLMSAIMSILAGQYQIIDDLSEAVPMAESLSYNDDWTKPDGEPKPDPLANPPVFREDPDEKQWEDDNESGDSFMKHVLGAGRQFNG